MRRALVASLFAVLFLFGDPNPSNAGGRTRGCRYHSKVVVSSTDQSCSFATESRIRRYVDERVATLVSVDGAGKLRFEAPTVNSDGAWFAAYNTSMEFTTDGSWFFATGVANGRQYSKMYVKVQWYVNNESKSPGPIVWEGWLYPNHYPRVIPVQNNGLGAPYEEVKQRGIVVRVYVDVYL